MDGIQVIKGSGYVGSIAATLIAGVDIWKILILIGFIIVYEVLPKEGLSYESKNGRFSLRKEPEKTTQDASDPSNPSGN